MRRVYERPLMTVERFVPNEYVASCGQTVYGKYLFECNAGTVIEDGTMLGEYHYEVFDSTGKCLTGSPTDKQGYGPCGVTHETDSTDDFISGYMIDILASDTKINEKRGTITGTQIPVTIWTEGGTNVHCTTELNQEHWEVLKS